MDVERLQQIIIDNPEHIYTILENLGHENIRDRGEYYQAKNIGGDNLTGCSVRKADLVWSNFSHAKSGSIFSMVQDERNCSFKDALYLVSKWIGVKIEPTKRIKPFNGFYKNIKHTSISCETDAAIYSEYDLPNNSRLSKKFIIDGISAKIQEEWGVRYDPETDGIIIPWENENGEIVGAKWRNNDPFCGMNERWNMYIKFQMSKYVYGVHKNKNNIQKKGLCIVFESEKSVMAAASMDCNIGLAVGGHNISECQARIIKGLFVNRIIIGFDAGLTESEVAANAEKLVIKNKLYKNHVGYVYDKTGNYMFDKNSPVDIGKKNFQDIINNCVIWIS